MASAIPRLLTADERCALVQVKIARAYKHITELNGAILAFFNAKPYEIRTKRNPNTRQLIYYVARATPVPDTFAAITGDAVQNLRSALDHLVHQLWFVANPGKVPHSNLQFPTDSSAAQYVSNAMGKIKGLRQDAIDAISRIEPYDGGKGQDFSVLNRLNRIDKHRLLVTVASRFQSFNFGAYIFHDLNAIQPGTFPKMDVYYGPANSLPLKAGDELFIDMPDAEVKKNMDFRFNVSLYEPSVIEGKPLLETVQHLADLVSNTVVLFKPCLS